ncbi:hypothetical protein SDC9_54767 [bioreactor metagenome]|uniref:Uncharacterized protein n=1 Tax=bioreactor metagenome TaxID=1076179 RepID=A0A644WX07_9ZZZZ
MEIFDLFPVPQVLAGEISGRTVVARVAEAADGLPDAAVISTQVDVRRLDVI